MKILQILYMLMKQTIKNTILCLTLFTAKTMTYAQEKRTIEPLITDRPDQTESPNVVSKGYIQIETGAAYEAFKNNNIKIETTTYNTSLVRFGLLNNLELRLGWDFVENKTEIYNNPISNINSGFSPLMLGIKISVSKENNWLPEIGLLGHIYLPFTAGSDYKPDSTGVDFRFAFANSLSEKSSLSYNLGVAWGNDSPEASYLYTIAYGYKLTEKICGYAEIYGDFPENSKANHLCDAGITYLITNNLQLDATFGTSITKGQDLMISAGLSYRIPSKNN
ncbi:outer membrane putative beta-barrel porin/alpha-amylase [Xanthomarina spongicola]|uniref:Outer membrane putative beta-barrel porin/alpha-amylase n=2 Tax=Xanthomarina spongicola TaxID=570520 RepID=A0A316DRT2_9FLAO|nr:outer membrane putative beta-barrel porin/alpha-amylase [Xanthomarina spongicola]